MLRKSDTVLINVIEEKSNGGGVIPVNGNSGISFLIFLFLLSLCSVFCCKFFICCSRRKKKETRTVDIHKYSSDLEYEASHPPHDVNYNIMTSLDEVQVLFNFSIYSVKRILVKG